MGEVTLLTLGDIHGRIAWNDSLRHTARDATAVLLTGDITNFGGPAETQQVIEEITAHCPLVYGVPGNCDSFAILEAMTEAGISLHGRGIAMTESIGLCGVGGSNRTPFGTPLEFDAEELETTLQAGWPAIADRDVRIIVHHAPPYRTRCDRTRLGLHVGVKSLRAFCEAEQPDLVVCGHIHEARGLDTIGATRVVNGGMAARGHGARITLSKGAVEIDLL